MYFSSFVKKISENKAKHGRIWVSKLDGAYRRKLIAHNVMEVNSLVVHPMEGYVYKLGLVGEPPFITVGSE